MAELYAPRFMSGETLYEMKIEFDEKIKAGAPRLQLLVGTAIVTDAPTSDQLWGEIETVSGRIAASYEMPMVNKRPGIAATRAAYKTFGKDPNRYRPSTEAMCRRIVRGDGLYRTTAIVDLINLLSIASGHSIGAFDMDKIVGDTLCLGVGREGEPYEAIHRGQLNIAGLPVLRDAVGGIATPTSDNARTAVNPDTKNLLIVVNIYGDEMTAGDVAAYATRLLQTYAAAREVSFEVYRPV